MICGIYPLEKPKALIRREGLGLGCESFLQRRLTAFPNNETLHGNHAILIRIFTLSSPTQFSNHHDPTVTRRTQSL
jgi:hypothetical protein